MIDNIITIIQQSTLTLPSIEVVLLVVLLSLSLMLRYNDFGMVVAYVFACRWGWGVMLHFSPKAQLGFVIFGFLVGALSVIGLISDRKL